MEKTGVVMLVVFKSKDFEDIGEEIQTCASYEEACTIGKQMIEKKEIVDFDTYVI